MPVQPFRTCRRLRLGALAAAAMLAVTVAPAAAATLFRDAPALSLQSAEQSGQRPDAVKREKLLVVDETALMSSVLGDAVGPAEQRVARASALDEPVTVPLFGGRSATLRRTAVEAAVDGGIVWNAAGTAREDFGILVVSGGRVTAALEVGGRSYRIEPAGPRGLHRLTEVDLAKFTGDRHLHPPRRPLRSDAAPADLAPAAIRTITLFVAYSSDAKTLLGDAVAKIQLDVSLTNRSLANSLVNSRLKLVGTHLATGYKPTADEPLMRLTFGSETWAKTVRAKRNTLKADLVAMYVGKRPYCGIAWVNSAPQMAAYAYGVVNAQCAGSKTLAHELGHAMGLLHDRYVEAAAGPSKYNYGYVSVPGKMMDVMSYPNKCYDLKIYTCKNVWYYSSPRVVINGFKLGVAKGTAGAADAARVLNEGAATIAAFR